MAKLIRHGYLSYETKDLFEKDEVKQWRYNPNKGPYNAAKASFVCTELDNLQKVSLILELIK